MSDKELELNLDGFDSELLADLTSEDQELTKQEMFPNPLKPRFIILWSKSDRESYIQRLHEESEEIVQAEIFNYPFRVVLSDRIH